MTKVRRINVSQIEGDSANNTSTDEIRPYGELAVYIGDNDKLELLMFDGVRTHVKSKILSKGTFYGGDADSGDGNGYDTIKLVPDEELRRSGSDQYLVVDPTGPNHIHIRAGGTQDSSNADLFLGGEQTHVMISDNDDTVTVRTSQVGEGVINRDWVFDNLGGLTFPDGTMQTTAFKQGENLYLMDGTNTDITVTEVDFNLLFAATGVGYSGSATHNVNLPVGTPGQRLVVKNISTLCALHITTPNGTFEVAPAGNPAELIYTSFDGWVVLYGATVV